MTIQLPQLSHYHYQFPTPDSALGDPDGLLAYGGDLDSARLLRAYQQGIFPWFSPEDPILWWSPSQRGVIDVDCVHLSKSLKKTLRKTQFEVTINRATEHVIHLCASTRPESETWITDEMVEAYQNLAREGHCHSVEVWENDNLVGGLYGVAVGGIFCGESMFSLVSNASKVAFAVFQHHFFKHGGVLIDCQMQNPHIASLGVIEVPRSEFLTMLKQGAVKALPSDFYHAQQLSNPWRDK